MELAAIFKMTRDDARRTLASSIRRFAAERMIPVESNSSRTHVESEDLIEFDDKVTLGSYVALPDYYFVIFLL